MGAPDAAPSFRAGAIGVATALFFVVGPPGCKQTREVPNEQTDATADDAEGNQAPSAALDASFPQDSGRVHPAPPVPPVHTADLSDAFFRKVHAGCLEIHCNPIELLSVWMNESGVSAKAWNPGGNASGLCQLMPMNLAHVGWHQTKDGKPDHAAFRALPAHEQVDYALRYYANYKGHLTSDTNDYVATFLPALLALPSAPDTVLCSHYPPPSPPESVLSWAYDGNKGFDRAKKNAIVRDDLTVAIHRACLGPRWQEIAARMKAAM